MSKIENFDKIFKFDFELDPTFGDGDKVQLPKCKYCKYSDGSQCLFYKKDKGQVLDDEDEKDLVYCSKYDPK